MKTRTPVFPCRTNPDLKRLMEDCGTCIGCGGDNDNLVAMTNHESPPSYSIECIRCDAMGPWAVSLAAAATGWRWSRY